MEPILIGIFFMGALAWHAINLRFPRTQTPVRSDDTPRVSAQAWQETVMAALYARYERLAQEHTRLMLSVDHSAWTPHKAEQIIRVRHDMREVEQEITLRGHAIPACDGGL